MLSEEGFKKLDYFFYHFIQILLYFISRGDGLYFHFDGYKAFYIDF
jgi:hypothetical protein